MINNKHIGIIKNLTGIILCGGQSCRFGTDKGLCMLDEKPMIQYAIDNLKCLCKHIIISSNDPKYNELGYPTVADDIKETGPIGGVLAGLEMSQTDDNLIVSCDMPFLNPFLLKYIFDKKGNSMAASAYYKCYTEPLCSYVNKSAIPLIKNQIKVKRYKMLDLLNNINYKKISIDDSVPFYNDHLFLNINAREQYDIAENILKINKNLNK